MVLAPLTLPPGHLRTTNSTSRIARLQAIGCHHQVMLDNRRHGDNMSADVGEMLRSAVSVRLRHRRFVVGNPEAHRAWKEGIEIVRAGFWGATDRSGEEGSARGARGSGLRKASSACRGIIRAGCWEGWPPTCGRQHRLEYAAKWGERVVGRRRESRPARAALSLRPTTRPSVSVTRSRASAPR